MRPPSYVSQQERIFERDGILRWISGESLGFAVVGIGLGDILKHLPVKKLGPSSLHAGTAFLTELLEVFAHESYVLWPAPGKMLIALKIGSTTGTQLKAWYHALVLARHISKGGPHTRGRSEACVDDVRETLQRVSLEFGGLQSKLTSAGWDIDTAAVETAFRTRIKISPNPRREGELTVERPPRS